MLLGLGAGLLAGLVLYLILGPAYQAETKILVSQKTGLPSADRTPNMSGERGEHITLIASDAIVHRALTDYHLAELPDYRKAKDPHKDIIESLVVSRIAGREHSKDNVFSITYIHTDKETARKTVSAIVDAYRDFLENRHDSTVESLSKELAQQQKALEAEIRDLEKSHFEWLNKMPPILRSSPVVSTSGGPMVVPNRNEQRLDRLTKLLAANQLAQDTTRSRIATLKEMLASGQPRDTIEFWIMHSLSSGGASGEEGSSGAGSRGGGATVLQSPPGKVELDSQLLSARMLEARMLQLVGPAHDDVKKIQRQIQTILSFYKMRGMTPPSETNIGPDGQFQGGRQTDLPSVYLATLESQLKFLATQEATLQTQLKQAEQDAKEASLLELENQRRKDEIIAKKTHKKQIDDQIAAFRQSRAQEGYTIQPISTIRVEKSLKRLIKIVGACGFLGVAVVFGLAYFREWQDTSLKTVEEARKYLGTQLIGIVPHYDANPAGQNASELSPALCYYHRPGSREAESYRTVRTTMFVATGDTGDKVIQVSSPEPSDGKTTTISNLAIAIAQSGKSVLLVDADLRRPTIHELFNARQAVGLAEVLRGEVDWSLAVRETRVDGLHVLTAGHCPGNPAELLSKGLLGQVLREARTDYDFILVDTPPLLAVSDPCIISPHVDGLLLVVRMHKNNRSAMLRCHDLIKTHGIQLYGVVANDASPEELHSGSQGYQEYYRSSDISGGMTPTPPPVPRGGTQYV